MARPEGHVFIACSLDGFIAREDGDIGWLTAIPAPEGEDYGYGAFVARMDAILMGRRSYEKVLTFGDWPYDRPVTVLSRSLRQADVPNALRTRVTITGASPETVFARLGGRGAARVYVDGGQVIQSCLRDGLVTRMTVTHIPVLLGEGLPLFGTTGRDVGLRLVSVRSWANGLVQTVYDMA
jgi:dihydrofolate reductase